VLAPYQIGSVAIRQGESNFPRPVGCARMGFQARLLAPDVEAGCFQGKVDFFNEASVCGRIADKNVRRIFHCCVRNLRFAVFCRMKPSSKITKHRLSTNPLRPLWLHLAVTILRHERSGFCLRRETTAKRYKKGCSFEYS